MTVKKKNFFNCHKSCLIVAHCVQMYDVQLKDIIYDEELSSIGSAFRNSCEQFS